MSPDSLPYFQQLQKQFTAYIRDPEKNNYAPGSEQEIETRRLKIYEALFFNNLHGFFSQLFPVCKEVLGEPRWAEMVREYMVKHQSQTPLFHELGEEFLDFLQNEFNPQEDDPQFLLELAHYEWVELALATSEERGFISQNKASTIDLDAKYELSPVAWPLAYEWPVHKIAKRYQPTEKPVEVTTLLVYRSEVDNEPAEKIDFMALTPLLYQWVIELPNSESAKKALFKVSQGSEIDEDTLVKFAQQTLMEFQKLGIIQAV
ncbi:DUF2063 domain-containing protein [Thiomicrorhabdus sp. Kp2]|uniref:HvfC family RiPP maturation protein n=1 Tax=Thiomicrorhabdus sp. Kp2 TaxID=1123518 RepID=UPI00041EDFF9|nr:putative DNA-binding domain-containing protein [Thiomicrorhabdus sp. Kp2]